MRKIFQMEEGRRFISKKTKQSGQTFRLWGMVRSLIRKLLINN